MLTNFIQTILRNLPPELAHNLAKKAMKRGWCAPGPYVYAQALFSMPINNRLGLAAGFDKNGELIEQATNYGFGWVEVGSVTWHGGRGNKKPRLFRVGDWDVMNRSEEHTLNSSHRL